MNNIKEEVKKKINEYSNEEYLERYIKLEFLTDKGDANIYLNIENKKDIFDKKTIGPQLELAGDIYDYIDEKASILNNDIQLNLHILNTKLKHEDQEKVRNLIKEHYGMELYKIGKEYKKCKNKIYKLVLLGLLFLGLYMIIAYTFNSTLFIEILGFMFSFSLWEALDFVIYNLSDIKRKQEEITQKLLMDIYFDKDDID